MYITRYTSLGHKHNAHTHIPMCLQLILKEKMEKMNDNVSGKCCWFSSRKSSVRMREERSLQTFGDMRVREEKEE